MRIIKGIVSVLVLGIGLSISAFGQIELTAVDGTRVNVEGQRGKVVVMAIGASWLPLSNKQSDFLNALSKKYAGRDVVFYFVATDSTRAGSKNFASDEAIRRFAFENKLAVPVLRDSEGSLTLRKFKVEQVPSFVILDKNGVLAGEPFGGIDPKYDLTVPIGRAIDKIL